MPDKYPGSSTLANKTETGTSQPPRHDQFPHWWSVICVMAPVRDHGSSMAALLGVQPEPTLGDIVQATVICRYSYASFLPPIPVFPFVAP
jgi:hypothetical protein